MKTSPEYDPVVKRWKAHCPHCGKIYARAKREAAEHVLAQHLSYEHEVQS